MIFQALTFQKELINSSNISLNDNFVILVKSFSFNGMVFSLMY